MHTGSGACIEVLINNHADVNKTDKNGHSALYIALEAGEYISNGPFQLKSQIFYDPLIAYNVEIGQREVAAMLIQKGANADLDLGPWKAVIYRCVIQSGKVKCLFLYHSPLLVHIMQTLVQTLNFLNNLFSRKQKETKLSL